MKYARAACVCGSSTRKCYARLFPLETPKVNFSLFTDLQRCTKPNHRSRPWLLVSQSFCICAGTCGCEQLITQYVYISLFHNLVEYKNDTTQRTKSSPSRLSFIPEPFARDSATPGDDMPPAATCPIIPFDVLSHLRSRS